MILKFIPLMMFFIIVIIYQKDKVIATFLSILLLTQFFSLLPKSFMQLYGFYSLPDIGFAALFCGYFIKKTMDRNRDGFPFRHYKSLFFLYLVLIVEIIYTIFSTGQGILLTLRMVRYFPYFMFIPVGFDVFQNEYDLKRFTKLFLPFFLLSSVIFIYQGITGKHLLKMTMIFTQNIGDYSVYRSYAIPPGVEFVLIVFIGLLLHKKITRWISILVIITSLLTIILSYTRAIYITTVLGILFMTIFCVLYSRKFVSLRQYLFIAVVFIVVIPVIGNFLLGSHTDFLKAIAYRFQSGINDFNLQQGNFAFRWQITIDRLNLIMDKNPILGVGWISNESSIRFAEYATISENFFTVDTAWASMLGSGGFLFIVAYLYFLTRMTFHLFYYAIKTRVIINRILFFSISIYTIILIISSQDGTSLISPTISFLGLIIGISERFHSNEVISIENELADINNNKKIYNIEEHFSEKSSV